jgi:DNA excision repair protein ERCC-6-like 2
MVSRLSARTETHTPDLANMDDASATEDEVADAAEPRRISPRPVDSGERLVWSSDEGLPLSKKTGKRKRTAKESRPQPKVKEPLRRASDDEQPRHRRQRKISAETASKGRDATFRELESVNLAPVHIQQRRKQFEAARDRLGDAGLKLPPAYDDIYFSDDDNPSLKEKPVFSALHPVRPKEDVILEYSAGIIPASIAQWLRDYQIEGAQFLHKHFVYQEGCILGDDMGLGKTIQVISFLTAAYGKTGDERDDKRMRKFRQTSEDWYPRVLIICPGGLIANWKSELDQWGWWRVYVFHGGKEGRGDALSAARSGRAEIVITTYATYRGHSGDVNQIQWDCVVADECHQIKDMKSETTKAMNDINALCRIGLTGTAIQNNYDELWTLLNWTNPGRFGSLPSWKTGISDPLRIGQAHDATVNQLALARRTAQKLVKNLLPPFFLRRMKTLIAHQLPKKSDRVVFCPLTDTQAEAYRNITASKQVETLRTAFDPCDCGSGNTNTNCCNPSDWQANFFPVIIALTKMANHLALIMPSGNDDREKQEKDLDLLKVALPNAWKELFRTKDNIKHFAEQAFCGKWKILRKLLEFWHDNGDKVLIFSHSVKLLKMLETLLKTTGTYSASYLDGSMTYEERAVAVDDFNSNPNQFVFLISTKAGGVGLNITSANKVVVVDPHWNPAYDLQAQDRAYRIGQTRNVEVFRLISAGTIEEIVYARQIYKQQQANIGYKASLERRYFKGIQNKKDGEIFGMKNLLEYKHDRMVLREIVNETNIAENRAGVTVADVDMGSQELGLLNDETFRPEDGSAATPLDAFDEFLQSQSSDGVKPAPKKKSVKNTGNGIEYILAQAGVQYTHENSEVIGTSKVEAKLSRQAMERGTADADTARERAFRSPSSLEEEGRAQYHVARFRISNSDKIGVGEQAIDLSSELDTSLLDSRAEEMITSVKLQYRPPEDIRLRQFCSMAKHFGYPNPTAFGLAVEKWTQEKRRECLEMFYTTRRKMLFAEMKENEQEL